MVPERRRSGPGRRVGCGLLLLAAASGFEARAQVDPRLTGEATVAQLDAAQRLLAERSARLPAAKLDEIGARLASLGEGLRHDLGKDLSRPLNKLDDKDQMHTLRAYAAAQQTQAWLTATATCDEHDAGGTAAALKSVVAQLAAAEPTGDNQAPTIWSVETTARRPVFGIRGGAEGITLALGGAHLHDPQCDDPLVTLAADDGSVVSAQPTLTGVLPDRLELKLPGALAGGTYTLRLRSQHKGRLYGCSKSPEATATFQVLAPTSLSIDYSLEQFCQAAGTRAGRSAAESSSVLSGSLPAFDGNGGSASRQLTLPACDATRYVLTAKVRQAGGEVRSVGPIAQSAAASISTGLPGGVLLNWDPGSRLLYAKAQAGSCAAIADAAAPATPAPAP